MNTYPFDYEKACFVLDSYGESTGLTCRLIDQYGKTITIIGNHDEIYQKLRLNVDKNSESFIYGANQASIFGGSYVYFGPYGLVYFTTPLLSDETIVGAFVVGPVLMTKPDNFFCTIKY